MRRVLLVLAVVAVAAGCSGEDQQRQAVEDYIARVNAVQADLEPAVVGAQEAIRRFSAGRTGPRLSQRLRDAAATMRSARAALRLMEPPPDARALHRHLGELLELQERLSVELSLAAAYLPEAVSTMKPFDAAGRRLQRGLGGGADAAAQRAALESYATAAGKTLGAFERLGPPPVLEPWHDAQSRRLRSSRRFATQLAHAIAAGDRAGAERALTALAESVPDPDATGKAQAAAVRAFNRLLDDQERLLDAIAREQGDLREQVSS